MKMTLPPEATFGRLPLQGAPLTVRQGRSCGGPGMVFLFACAICPAEVI